MLLVSNSASMRHSVTLLFLFGLLGLQAVLSFHQLVENSDESFLLDNEE